MTDFIHLIGAEDVQRAASTIQSAASTMQQAASSMDETLHILTLRMEGWLLRIEQVTEKLNAPGDKGEG